MPGIVETIALGFCLAMYCWGYWAGHRAGTAKQRIKTERIMERMLSR